MPRQATLHELARELREFARERDWDRFRTSKHLAMALSVEVSEVVELSTAHARKQFDALSEQVKELSAFAQKVANDTAEPLKEGVTSAFKKVA